MATMIAGKETFGAYIRREREARRLGLRQMAKKIGVSPTCLSKVERDEFTTPTEEKVRAIARFIERDPDELLAMAGRVSSDILDIIKRHPMELSTFLRSLSDEDIARLRRNALEAPEAKARPHWVKNGR
jgi:transcriptional regulator with XRE-family HTH domain